MAEDTIHNQEVTVLNTISSFFTALGQHPPVENARMYVLESGFHFVSSTLSSRLQHQTLGRTIEAVEGSKDDGKDEAGEYKLVKADPVPEVIVYDKIVAVWAAIQHLASDGAVSFRSYAAFFLVKLDDDSWKISGFAHAQPEALAPLPPIGKEMTPEIERLLHFPDEMLKARNLDILPDWVTPGARMVRHRSPDPPTAAPVEDFVRQLMG